MQKKDVVRFFKKKGTVVVMSLCLVGAVAFATYYTMEGSKSTKDKQENIVDLNEEQEETTEMDAITEHATEASNSKITADKDETTEKILSNDMDVDPASLAKDETEASVGANSGNVQAKINPTVDFQENDSLTWPVAGTVVMDYSMDATVYFKTLNQYKYNPALVIGTEVNSQVLASAKGIVESIEVDEETGTTLTLDMGNEYKLIYGQLKEVPVAVGDVVEEGSLLGYVGEPTKYYCEEGTNLFFEMTKDGSPVDPFMYLE